MRGGQVVPLARPAERPEAGQIGLVCDRPVRVAALVRALAAAVGLDPLADLPVAVGLPARLQVALGREVVVRRLPRRDPLRSDHAGVADVDHVRVAHVETDPEPHQEDGHGGEQPHRPHRGLRRRRPTTPPDPGHAAEQIDERRVDERHAREHVALVEVPERHREREQDEQVEVAQREGAPEVGEPDQERGAEPEPHGQRVDLPAAEGAAVATGHLPGHLGPRPRLGDRAGRIVHLAGRHLAGRARPDLHGPGVALLVEGGLLDPRLARVVAQPAGDLPVCEERALRPLLAQLRRLGRRRERAGDEVPLPVVDRPRRGGRRLGARRSGRRRQDEEREERENGATHRCRLLSRGGTTRACCR